MKKFLAAFKASYWARLTTRERKTIVIGSVILMPLLIWTLLWKPAHNALSKLQQELPRLRTKAEEMQSLASHVQSLRQRPRPAVLDGEALKAIIEHTAQEAGLSIEVVPEEKNSVRIRADSLPFTQWLAWLETLDDKQHVRLSSATIIATAEPGKIRLQATLTNGTEE